MKNLSGGELQRVALTLALGTPADIYLIDEPSAYLDSEQRIIAAKVRALWICTLVVWGRTWRTAAADVGGGSVFGREHGPPASGRAYSDGIRWDVRIPSCSHLQLRLRETCHRCAAGVVLVAAKPSHSNGGAHCCLWCIHHSQCR